MIDGGAVSTPVSHDPPADRTAAPGGVLIVDDQVPFRSVARTLVGMLKGWHVAAEAGSGEEALELVEATNPGLVLMDINLPGINGIEATRRILERRPATIVVLLSTYAHDDLPQDALSCGAAGYIRKDDLTPRLLRALVDS
jgi:two-component system, NarL family, invasion response regulator UvrY